MRKAARTKLVVIFDDLPLHGAVRQLFDDPEFVRTESLLIEDAGREWVIQKVISLLPKDHIGYYRFERILLAVNQFRKLNQEHRKKRLIILEHTRKMTRAECFYKGKVGTECSNKST